MNEMNSRPVDRSGRSVRLRSLVLVAAAGVLAILSAPVANAQSCRGDFDLDGSVGGRDFARLLDDWGKCAGCGSDLDGDGMVDGGDLGLLLASWGPCAASPAAEGEFQQHSDGSITYRGRKFGSWNEYAASTDPAVWRCGARAGAPFDGGTGGPEGDGGVAAAAADCDWDATIPRTEYQPNGSSPNLCIPVVVHVIRDDTGVLGNIPTNRIVGQINILNQRFAPARIRFQLANIDPLGAPTIGILFHDNTTWYNDLGDYWTTLAWDTSRYLNIYTNAAGGTLGYSNFPWSFPPGDPQDRIVIRSDAFGLNPGAPTPGDLGLTCVHQAGHYLGLYHTFHQLVDLNGDGSADQLGSSGCGFGCCYASGDLCCDTNREEQANQGCLPAPATCNDGLDPVQNYMDYSDDACLTHFTREQIGRMRCTLLTRRATLPGPCLVPGDLNGDGVFDAGDLTVLLSIWGACTQTPCVADLNFDGLVDAADLTALFNAWPVEPLPARTVPGWATLIESEPDPAVVTNSALRNAMRATGLAWRVRDNATQIEMMLVPPGTFSMGCSPASGYGCLANELPVHSVTLTCPFYIGRYEVTQTQWTAQMGSNPSFFVAANGYPGSGDRPVERVSWNQIQVFLTATGLRLPTEAEWEYAYRAGTTTAFHSMPGFTNGTNSEAQLGNIAWYYDNTCGAGAQCCLAPCGTRPVGELAPNALGLHDMSGNVWEWVNDWYSASYYSVSPSKNPAGPATGTYRVLRGGSWNYSSSFQLRSSYRNYYSVPELSYFGYGFRVVREP